MTSARGEPTGRRLGLLLLGYLGAVVAVIVLAPFRFGPMDPARVLLLPEGGNLVADVILNVALFVPLGFLLERVGGGRLRPVRVVLLGVVASLLIEATQLFVLDRYSTATDVAANAAGAWLGALASHEIRRRLGSTDSLTGRLFLDLPLLGLTWLLLPILWVESLQGFTGPMISVAAAGGFAMAGAGRSNAARARQPGGVLWPMVIGWSLLGALPVLGRWPIAMAIVMLSTTLAFVLGDRMWQNGSGSERRVEPRAVFAILVSLAPWFLIKGWTDVLHPQQYNHLRVLILEWLAMGAAFTALGYALSEWRGRTTTPWPASALAPTLVAIGVAIPVTRARPAFVLAAAIVAAFGALLFEVQRAHVVASRLRRSTGATLDN